MKKIIRKMYRVLHAVKKLFLKRKKLNRETVVVCHSSWKDVNVSSYNNEKYDIYALIV